MKTLRITAALLLALVAACTGSPTVPSVDAPGASAHVNGTGFLGGGTRQP